MNKQGPGKIDWKLNEDEFSILMDDCIGEVLEETVGYRKDEEDISLLSKGILTVRDPGGGWERVTLSDPAIKAILDVVEKVLLSTPSS